jgi:hypothetical protein
MTTTYRTTDRRTPWNGSTSTAFVHMVQTNINEVLDQANNKLEGGLFYMDHLSDIISAHFTNYFKEVLNHNGS